MTSILSKKQVTQTGQDEKGGRGELCNRGNYHPLKGMARTLCKATLMDEQLLSRHAKNGTRCVTTNLNEVNL